MRRFVEMKVVGGDIRWWVNVFREYVWDTGRNEFTSSMIVYFSY
jgi:hypothetical protein